MTIRYYQSDSPCRRCNGTTRYRNTELKGKCVNCVSDADRDRWARNWVETTRADEDDGE